MPLSRINNPFLSSSGAGNASITSPAANTVAFTTATTERMRIDSSGNLGIGTSNIPSNKDTVTPKLIVNGAGVAGSMQVVRNTTVGAGGGVLELTATRGADVNSYTILQSGDGIGSVIFGGADGNEFVQAATIVAQVDGTPGDNDMPGRLIFSTTADGASTTTERMRIDSAGLVTIASGQIKFPASQNASADANTLDDYEEGTFTPTIVGTSTAGTATYVQQVGRYTKIGDRVLISIYLQWSGGTGTGSMNISGLPFTSDAATLNQSLSNYNGGVAMTAGHVMQLITSTNSTAINVNSVPSGGGSDANVPYDASALIIAGGSYKAS